VSLDLVIAITCIAKSNDKETINNKYGWGQKIQMSFFGHPTLYSDKWQKPKKYWDNIGWKLI
jgi:hypothetical protein